ncbi:MAG: hypothetical protein H0V44_11690 [Planctomycetes bacterium]|nr:hypothetical protein [Planctomycetota bacterium]
MPRRSTASGEVPQGWAHSAIAGTWLLILSVPRSAPATPLTICSWGSPGAGGALAVVLEARDSRTWLVATLGVVPSDGTVALRGAQSAGGDLAAGVTRVSAPIAAGRRTVSLRYDGAHLELHIDALLVDEEWPMGALCPSPAPQRTAIVRRWRAGPRWLDDGVLARWHGGRLVDPVRSGTFHPAYWRPAGHDTNVGDVMLMHHDGRLHLFWLFDRKGHHAKWGTGAHQFYHASSGDLRKWRHHPPTLRIERPWEGFGTGAVVVDANGGWHCIYQLHGERTHEGSTLKGVWAATSVDGDQWQAHAFRCGGVGDPTVYRAHDRWHLVNSGQRRESTDLRSWRLADERFLPVAGHAAPGGNSEECPCIVTWRGWTYALLGRTGFWMARDPLGPFWAAPDVDPALVAVPRWSPYDGLMVPMLAVHGERCLLAGWVRGDADWGGVLVWREMIQEADGTLGMRWAEDMLPKAGRARPLRIRDSASEDASAPTRPASTLLRADACAFADLPAGSWRLSCRIEPGSSLRALAIAVGADGAQRGGAELVLEGPNACARWATPDGGALPPMPVEQPFHGRNVVIDDVEGLDRPFTLEIICWRDRDGWVLDACIDRRRTLICFRPDLSGTRLRLAAHGGEATISDVTIAPLASPAVSR